MGIAQIASTKVFAGLKDAVLAERARWPLWLPVSLGAGIAVYFSMPAEPPVWAAVAAAFASAVAFKVAGKYRFRLAILLFAVAAAGFVCAKVRTEWVRAPVLERKIGPVRLIGRVVWAEVRATGLRMVLEPEPIRFLRAATPARVRLTARYADFIPAPGSFVRVTAVLMPPPGPAMPGGYDFGRWAFFQRVGAVGYLYGKPHAAEAPRAGVAAETVSAGIQSLRRKMTARIRDVLPGPEGAISAALITGQRGEITTEDDDAYRNSGLYHVLSISGVHLALAGGIFFWSIRALLALFPFIALRFAVKKIAAVAALSGALFYLIISGCDIPAVRSFVMLAAMFFAILIDRPALSMRSVALAAAIVLVVMPESLLDAGCQMSFASVIGLIALAEGISARRKANPPRRTLPMRLVRYAAGIGAASLIAGLVSAPIAIFHFERAAQYGLISNLAAEPVVGFVIMPAATAAMVLMPAGLDAPPLRIMGLGVQAMTAIARWTAAIPGAGSLVPGWPLWCLAAVMLGFLWIAIWQRRWRWLGLIPIAAGVAFALCARPPDILVARDFGAVAVRRPDGKLMFLKKPKDKFAAESWLQHEGDERKPRDALAGNGVSCDAYGCIAHAGGGATVAFDLRPEALFEDCERAAIVISAVPVRDMCKGPFVIDRFDIVHAGGYAIWLDKPWRIETVTAVRGLRPWSMPPRRRSFSTAGSTRPDGPAP